MRALFVVLTCLSLATLCQAATLTVDDDGPADYASIQAAINDANDGDTVLVSQGHYFENIDFRGKVITVASTNPDDPSVVADTIIDANGDGIVVSFHMGEGPNSVIDGFTITGGNAQYGAGVTCWESSSPTVSNCTITSNSATGGGGGIYCYNSDPEVSDCTIRGNLAEDGGGMYNEWYSSPTVTGCTSSGNSAELYGGGMYNGRSSPTVSNCTFSGNSAGQGGGGMRNSLNSSPTVTGCTFSGNSARSGGGMSNRDPSSLTVVGCTFSGNSAELYGGGMYNREFSSPTVSGCNIIGNSARSGGGMYNDHSAPTVSNCTFSSNSANEGGGVYCGNSSDPMVSNCTLNANLADLGGGIYSTDLSVPVITNNIIANSASGSGIYAIYSNPIISYNNVWGNADGDYGGWAWPGEGDISVDPCFVDPGHWDDPCGTPGDPNDDIWVDGDYHLKSEGGRWDPCSEGWVLDDVTSLCIDAGYPYAPLGLELSPHRCRVNMGAYGGTEQASKSPVMASACCEGLQCAGQSFGDATCDGAVNLADLFAIKASFGTSAPWTGNECCTDFTHDWVIDLADLFILKANFGTSGYVPSTLNQACPP